jgi:hypothetical protein
MEGYDITRHLFYLQLGNAAMLSLYALTFLLLHSNETIMDRSFYLLYIAHFIPAVKERQE